MDCKISRSIYTGVTKNQHNGLDCHGCGSYNYVISSLLGFF